MERLPRIAHKSSGSRFAAEASDASRGGQRASGPFHSHASVPFVTPSWLCAFSSRHSPSPSRSPASSD